MALTMDEQLNNDIYNELNYNELNNWTSDIYNECEKKMNNDIYKMNNDIYKMNNDIYKVNNDIYRI